MLYAGSYKIENTLNKYKKYMQAIKSTAKIVQVNSHC